MPSTALVNWQNDRLIRLGLVEAQCASLLPAPPAAVSPLVEESLQGFVVLVSGHFQGFCRDLYTECTQLCASVIPPSLRTTIQAQFAAGVALNSGNPTHENIRKDFERFGFLLDLSGAAPANPQRITHLAHLNYWRNHVAHQKATPPPIGVPAVLRMPDIQSWRTACDGLATSLDDIMKQELTRILGAAPW